MVGAYKKLFPVQNRRVVVFPVLDKTRGALVGMNSQGLQKYRMSFFLKAVIKKKTYCFIIEGYFKAIPFGKSIVCEKIECLW